MCDTLTQMRSGVGLELYETTQCVNLFGYIFYRHFRLRAGGIRSGSGCPKTRSCPDRGRREVGAASKQCNSCADLQNPYRPILEHVIWQLKRRAYFCSHYFFAPVAFFFFSRVFVMNSNSNSNSNTRLLLLLLLRL